jgi:serine protease Do
MREATVDSLPSNRKTALMFLQRVIFAPLLLACLACSTGFAAEPDTDKHWLSRIRLLPGEHERSHRTVKSAFRSVVQNANDSTVRVLLDGLQVSLGAVVHKEGYVVTKASELKGPVECQFTNGRRLAAKLVGVHNDYDLALLKVNVEGLPAVKWSSSPSPKIGSWLATSSTTECPTAIGIVSANARMLPKPQTVLGVGLEQSGRQVRVTRVLAGSAAAKAGILQGDIIVSIGEKAMGSPKSVSTTIRQMLPGDTVALIIERGNRSLSIAAALGEASRLGNPDQAELMDSLGGPLSARRVGFPYVLQHDTVLRPEDCGGPLVDLDGNVVGLNIARVSRVASYAIPAQRIEPLVAAMLAGKYPPPDDSIALERVSTTD